MRRFGSRIIMFMIGIVLFIIGVVLVSDLILKFLKFAIGLILIFIAIPMMLGSYGFWGFRRRTH